MVKAFNETKDWPGGLENRFLPANESMIVSGNSHTQYCKMWNKHKKVISVLANINNDAVIDLDSPLSPENNLTICKWLSSKKNKKGYPILNW